MVSDPVEQDAGGSNVGKNVVVCCDGTGNQFGGDYTNVVKLYLMLVPDKWQMNYYHAGLGTMPFVPTRKNVMSQGLGLGIQADIMDVYTFLIKNYEPGDRLFLFGFSRGAYTVRAVASMLHVFGLFLPGHEHMVAYLLNLLLTIGERPDTSEQGTARTLSAIKDMRRLMSSPCNPWFVGIWDTVASVDLLKGRWSLPFLVDNPSIEIGRHAVAIDERRAFFPPLLWHSRNNSSAPSDIKQVWFPGVHADVGGGYAESESGLCKITLEWMLNEAKSAGPDDRCRFGK